MVVLWIVLLGSVSITTECITAPQNQRMIQTAFAGTPLELDHLLIARSFRKHGETCPTIPMTHAANNQQQAEETPARVVSGGLVRPKRFATTICHHCKKQIRVRPERGDWLNAIEMVKHGECRGSYAEVSTERIIWPNMADMTSRPKSD